MIWSNVPEGNVMREQGIVGTQDQSSNFPCSGEGGVVGDVRRSSNLIRSARNAVLKAAVDRLFD
jgi:hypothetical protein